MSGKESQEINPKTKEFMIKIDAQVRHINERLEQIPTRDEMKLANEKLVQRVLVNCDKRYASKTTEKVVYCVVGIIIMWTVNSLMNIL